MGHRLKKSNRVKYGVWVTARNLFVDPKYQRKLVDGYVRQLVKEFNPSAFGELTVSERPDGRLAVVEGQHRLAAAMQIDPGMVVPCTVHYGLNVCEEANLFQQLNKQKKPSAVDTFKAGLVAGNPEERFIASTLARWGLCVGRSKHDNRQLRCPTALRAIVSQGPDALPWVLGVASDAWGWEYAVNQQVLLGIARIYEKYNSKIDPTELAQRMSKNVVPDGLMAIARSRGLVERQRPSYFVADSLLTIYNKGKRAGKVRRVA